jgi:hypothetical protein
MNNATKKTTRRGLELFEKNPYILEAALNTVDGVRRRTVQGKDGAKLMVTNEDTGEIVGPAGFWQTQEVDRTQFVKLYVNGVKAFKGLSPAGTKVFELLYLEVQKSTNRDRVYLSFSNLPDPFNSTISQGTYTRGMRELMDEKFVAPTSAVGWYWVNPDYMWNGDRLAMVKEYRIKRDIASDQVWREKLEAQGQQRLEV